MKKIKLSKHSKIVLRLLCNEAYERPQDINRREYNAAINELENLGLVYALREGGGAIVAARLTEDGKQYIAINPALSNPINWKSLIQTLITLLSLLTSLAALFVACRF